MTDHAWITPHNRGTVAPGPAMPAQLTWAGWVHLGPVPACVLLDTATGLFELWVRDEKGRPPFRAAYGFLDRSGPAPFRVGFGENAERAIAVADDLERVRAAVHEVLTRWAQLVHELATTTDPATRLGMARALRGRVNGAELARTMLGVAPGDAEEVNR